MTYIAYTKRPVTSEAEAIYPDLLAWWDFEENDSSTAWIDSHSTHDMTLLASRTTSQDTINTTTVVGRSVFVNTSADSGAYAPRADTAFDKADTGFSFGFWWRTFAMGVDDLTRFLAGRLGGSTGSDQGYYVQLRTLASNQGFIFGARNSGNTANTNLIHSGSVPIAVDTWYFVVFAHDPTNDLIIGYVNGTKQSTAFSGGPYASTTANWSFGNGYRSDTTYYDTSRDHVGYFDSMFFLNRVITDGEEAYLRNSGSGKNYAQLVLDSGY